MKLIFRLLFLSLLSLLVAAGCASAPSTTAPAGDSAASSGESQERIIPGQGLQKDVSLVANTGKPQFLDSYAEW